MHLPGHARRTLAALLTVTVALGSLAVAPALATTRGDGLRAAANAEREARDRAPVDGTGVLDAIADARADQMRDADRLRHDMEYVKQRLAKADVCWTKFGEIIAWQGGADYSYGHTIGQWMNSDPHRAIMLDPDYNAAGGSWATAADGGHYSVMIFVRLCGSDAARSSSLTPKRVYSPDRAMRFVRGEHRAVKLDANGKVLDSRTVTFGRPKNDEASGRARVDGRAYLKVASGTLAGWWVRENPRQYVRGMTQKREYAAKRHVHVERGKYTAFRFDSLGRATDSATASLARDRRYETTARAIINGRAWFRIASGPLAGHWLRDNRDVRLVH